VRGSGHGSDDDTAPDTYLPTAPGATTAPQVVLDLSTEGVAASADVTLVGYATPGSGERLSTLRSVADSVGLDAGQVVLAWMSQRPTPVLPIAGVSRPDHVRSAWQAVTQALPDHAIARLDTGRA